MRSRKDFVSGCAKARLWSFENFVFDHKILNRLAVAARDFRRQNMPATRAGSDNGWGGIPPFRVDPEDRRRLPSLLPVPYGGSPNGDAGRPFRRRCDADPALPLLNRVVIQTRRGSARDDLPSR